MYCEIKVPLFFVAILSQTFAKPYVNVKIKNTEGDKGICCSISKNADIEKLPKDGYTIIKLDGSLYIYYGYYEMNQPEIEKRNVGIVKQRSRRDAQLGHRNDFISSSGVHPYVRSTPRRCPRGKVRDISGRCTYRFHK
ncbi:hypothetical protein HHI36_016326 [Cryptolaemus montrouzieri]|uniref:Uncharacterized protein n=1 Tax=Cryptolaemus montrouzieri TaxID=559131 RepID=A0ABD2NJH1_9CUCU